MYSKRKALQLIRIAGFHSVLFLVYGFIHPRFNLTNFYYFPLVILVCTIIYHSFNKIKKPEESEVDNYEKDYFVIYLLYSPGKLFIGFCTAIYLWGDIFLAHKGSIKDLRVIIDLLFIFLIWKGPGYFLKDSDTLSLEFDSRDGDSDYVCLKFDQLAILICAGIIALVMILNFRTDHGISTNPIYYFYESLHIPIFIFSVRLFTYDFIISKKVEKPSHKIPLTIILYSTYTLFCFGLTAFLIFPNIEGIFNLKLIISTIALYTLAELFQGELGKYHKREAIKKFNFENEKNKKILLELQKWEQRKKLISLIKYKADMPVNCVNCNFSIRYPNTNLCPNCGSDIYLKSEFISCVSCGGEYDNSEDSCPYCGHIPSL